ncbi:MAG: ribosome recycling factor [Planctomycetota bacterium]|nr:MAG: ribosome recycling factor [Planctomycetota bacterium]
MSFQDIVNDSKARLDKALGHLSDHLRGIRTGRASPALVDNVRVDYYGTQTPLNQVASISVPEPRQLLIKPFDVSALKEIARAISKSDLGCSPQEDGKVVRLSLPPLSGDQRNKFAAKVKEMCEEARVVMRNVRRDANKAADTALKDHKMTEDDNKRAHTKIQELLKEYEGKVDDVQKKKTAEIMEH